MSFFCLGETLHAITLLHCIAIFIKSSFKLLSSKIYASISPDIINAFLLLLFYCYDNDFNC